MPIGLDGYITKQSNHALIHFLLGSFLQSLSLFLSLCGSFSLSNYHSKFSLLWYATKFDAYQHHIFFLFVHFQWVPSNSACHQLDSVSWHQKYMYGLGMALRMREYAVHVWGPPVGSAWGPPELKHVSFFGFSFFCTFP